MSTPTFDPEDPRLTAYALGELTDPADRAEVESLLEYSPKATAALKEIRDITASLTQEYERERFAPVSGDEPEMLPNVVRLSAAASEPRRSWLRPLLAAAAVFLVTVALASLTPVFRGSKPGRSFPPVSAAPVPAAPMVTQIEPVPTMQESLPQPIAPGAGNLLAQNDQDTPVNTINAESPPAVLRSLPKNKVAALGSFSPAPALLSALPATGELQRILLTPPTVTLDQNRGVTTASPSHAAAQPAAKIGDSVTAYASRRPGGSLLTRQFGAKDFDRFADASKTAPDLGGGNVPVEEDTFKSKSGTRALRALPQQSSFNTAAYDHLTENSFLTAKENPLSTFSIDVDTASYANVRRFIEGGSLPPPDAVRVEELINYFPYDYAPPAPDSGKPFAVHLEAAACPWAPEHRLVRIGIKGREISTDKRPASNLVFLIDVSGSMMPPERLPLIKRAMSMMVEHLNESDHVAIVTYAGNTGLALPSTSGDHKDTILTALDRLEAGGSTNGAAGIKLAYQVAKEGFIKGGTNRVILATDGDFNVGVTSQGALVRLIQDEAKSGVFLSALGVGDDNYKDATMQKLADKGNGNYHYIDRLEEARKVLVDQMGGTLVTIAKDVKIQVEFNPAVVASYRLIGYEKRMLRKEDFNDDKIDAGEIGAGRSVTALYEVVSVGQPTPGAASVVDALKYAAPAAPVLTLREEPEAAKQLAASPEMLTVKMRYKAPDADQSERADEVPLTDTGAPGDYAQASVDFKFAAAVAEFGLVLRDSPYKSNAMLGAATELAQDGKGADVKGYRAGFIELTRHAQALKEGGR